MAERETCPYCAGAVDTHQPSSRLAMSWHVSLGNRAQLYLRGSGPDPSLATESMAILLGEHRLTAVFDPGYAGREWSVDEQHIRRGSGVDVVRNPDEHRAMATYLHDSGIVAELTKLVTDIPFPAILTPAARLGGEFSADLLEAVVTSAGRALEARHFSVFTTTGSASDGPSGQGVVVDGYCAPEFRICTDRTETTEVVDPLDPPSDDGGAGGGVGGGDFADWCERQYRSELLYCYRQLTHCREDEGPDLTDADVRGDDLPPPPVGADLLRAASDLDRCFRQFEICLDDLMWGYQYCLLHGSWPT